MPPLYSWPSAFLFALLPSPVQRRLRPDDPKPRRLTATSWLDGLRGVAALFVYINHYTGRNFRKFQHAYGDHELVDWSTPLQLPFVRVIYCGFPMVHIFFVVSGFALSYKPLKLARSRNYRELHEALSSSVFRRAFRLFLPTMASTLFVMLVAYLGIEGPTFPTLVDHLWDWYAALWKITDSWSWDLLWYPTYDVHLWTIGIEYSHSMLLFLTMTGTSRMRPPVRMALLVAIITYCLKCGHWGPAEFLGGAIMAEMTMIQSSARSKNELDLFQEAGDDAAEGLLSPRSSTASLPSAKRIAALVFLVGNLVFALFVAGWPNGNVENLPGFAFLYRNTMEPYWTAGGNILIFPWYALGAMQIVVAIHQIPALQSLFVTSAAQYLGDISFSLYLMHGPLQVILEPRCLPFVWALVGGTEESAGMWRSTMAWFAGLVVLAPPTLWISDIFWRYIDVQSVRFARWLERLCCTE